MLSKGSLKSRVYKRAMGLIGLNNGQSFQEVSKLLGVSYQAVSTWSKNYKSEGLSFLKDKPRPGRPLEIDALQRAKITALACSEPPEGHAKWTLRLLADKLVELDYCDRISHSQVGIV
ncbi:MAG: helix-turn-helix domain-containing protein [Candidatus Nitrosomaritimum yanchengensis]